MISADVDMDSIARKRSVEYIKEYENVHLTKFVPTRFASMANKLVNFRNKVVRIT